MHAKRTHPVTEWVPAGHPRGTDPGSLKQSDRSPPPHLAYPDSAELYRVHQAVSCCIPDTQGPRTDQVSVLKLKLDPRADIDMLRRTFKEVLNHVATLEIGQNLGDLDDSSVSVADQDIFGILVWFSIPCRDPNTSWEVACAVRERLLAEAARIERETGNPVFPSPVAAGAA